MKSVQVKVTALSNEAINDETNNVHSEPEVINDEFVQEGHAENHNESSMLYRSHKK